MSTRPAITIFKTNLLRDGTVEKAGRHSAEIELPEKGRYHVQHPRVTHLAMIALCGLMALAVNVSGQDMNLRASDLEKNFRDPPPAAGIRCFWWWLNGNVDKEAVSRDLEEMKAKGYSGALIFDADGSGQRNNRRVPAGPTFAGPEWTELFVHACQEAERLGLELSLNIQSGWNLGGPRVTAEEASQHLIWSETKVEGPGKIERKLARPAGVRAGFYRNVSVLAVLLPSAEKDDAMAGKIDWEIDVSSTQSTEHASRNAVDGQVDTFWVSAEGPSPENPQWLMLKLSKPEKVSKLYLRGRKGYGPREFEIQLSEDGKEFQTVTKGRLEDGEALNAEFEEQRARSARVLITSAYDKGVSEGKARNVQVAELFLPDIMAADNLGSTFRPVKDLELKNASRELGMSAPDCRFLLETSPPVPGEPAISSEQIIDISDKMEEDGMLRWDAPEGEWVILRFGHTPTGAHVSTHSAGWGGRVLDYMNPDSLINYWNRNIEPLIEAIGPLAGSAFRYTHTDSWEGGGMNWTPGFEATFKENRGYDPIPWLAVLAGYIVDSREASNAFLADFRKTIGDRVAAHYALLAELSKQHGMGTHPECSGPHAGPMDGLKNYGRSELMMSEFWAPSPHRPRPSDRFFVKQAASAAHTYGGRLVGAEGFTTIGTHWNVVPWSALKPSFDHELCDGLNLLFHHTFTCSPKKMGLPGQEYFAGTHFNPQITCWEETPAFIDYLKRCQYLAQQGQFVADVLYYYGDHIPNIAGRKATDPAGALPGFDYDLLSEELLLGDLAFGDGQLELSSGMRYRILVLPDHRVLSLGALKKVDELVRAGATVLGPKPLRAVSLEGGERGKEQFRELADSLWGGTDGPSQKSVRKVGKGRVAWGMTAREFLLADGIPRDVAFKDQSANEDIGWIHYRVNGGDLYFLSNQSDEARQVTSIFRCSGKLPELWNAVDGAIREAGRFSFVNGRTEVPLAFDAYGSVFVFFREPAHDGRHDGPNVPRWKRVDSITGPWDVRFDPRWGGPRNPVQFEELKSWTACNDPGIQYYSGKASYRTQFDIAEKHIDREHPLAVELGKVGDLGIARVILNGQDLGVAWRPPFRVDITEAARAGENSLEVEVVNSWRNRLFRDARLPEAERLTRTNIKVQNWRTAIWDLEPSGLFGPVTLSVRESR